MQDKEAEQAIAGAMKDIIVTVQDLHKQRKIFPALILRYSSLDIAGSLLRPKSQLDTTGEDFKKWLECCVLRDSSLPATSDDLWAARCGLLHTNTPASKNSRSGKAREVHSTKGDKKFAEFLQQEFKKTGDTKVVVDIDVLFDAILDGFMKFIRDIQTDAEIRAVVFYHAETMFAHSSYKVA
jgi:hypothetical protein